VVARTRCAGYSVGAPARHERASAPVVEEPMADGAMGRPERVDAMNGHKAGPHHDASHPFDQVPTRWPVRNPDAALLDDMLEVRKHGRIALYCGEAHPDIYNSQAFLGAARELAKSKKAEITAITGPVMLVPEDERELNGLLLLAKDGTLSGLYHRRSRFTLGHFRVVETGFTHRLYREHPHAPGEDVGTRWCDNMSRFTEESKQAQAEDALYRFDTWKSMSVPHADAKWQGLPLVTTPNRLEKIVTLVKSQGLDFNYLAPEEIMDVANGAGAKLIEPLATYQLKIDPRA
jgi:hypothetical protein